MNFDSLMSSLRSTVNEIKPVAQEAVGAARAVQDARAAVQLARLQNDRTVAEAQFAYQAAAAQMSPAFSPWQTNAQRFNTTPPAGAGISPMLLLAGAALVAWMVLK
jgi:hypothetical protein